MIGLYLRISTDKQQTDSQQHAIKLWLEKNRPMAAFKVYQDVESGRNDKRVELANLCQDIAEGKVKTVVVYRLDRLSRKATTALTLLMGWIANGIEFFATEQPALSASANDPFRLTKLAMFSEIAQIERETIVGRVKSGLAAARARGVKLGKPSTITAEQMAAIYRARNCGKSMRETAKEVGLSIASISRVEKKSKKAVG